MDPKETTIFTAIVISSVVIGIIILYFVISIIRQQRRNLELHRLNILAEINTMEKERSRIASDLHDDLGPILSAVKFKINSINVSDEEDKHQLSGASAQLDDLLKRLREIAYDLMPSALLRKGLIVALEEFTRNFEDSSLKLSFTHSALPELSQEKSIHVFRIIQEVVHNTIKHAKAHELIINLSIEENFLNIVCRDDGVGFNPDMNKEKSGIGLKSLRSRSEIVGGSMAIDSAINKGTRLMFKIPL